MKQYEFHMVGKLNSKQQVVRATAVTAEIARLQLILAYGDQYTVADLPADMHEAHKFTGEIDCSEFPVSDIEWLRREAKRYA